MRLRTVAPLLGALALTLALGAGRAPAVQDNEEKPKAEAPAKAAKGGVILDKKDKLTDDDPKDKVRSDSHAKKYKVKFTKGKTYQIDMMSKDLDSYLRLEGPGGEQVAEDDDGGDGLNARIRYKAPNSGTYTVIATSYDAGETGPFHLVVRETGAARPANEESDKNEAKGEERSGEAEGGKFTPVKGIKLPEKGKAFFQAIFPAGQEAEAWVESAKETDVDLYVFDKDHKLVAKDITVGKDCHVTWTPKRGEVYEMVVINLGPGDNVSRLKCSEAINPYHRSTKSFNLNQNQEKSFKVNLPAGKLALIAVRSEKETDVDLFVYDADDNEVAKDERVSKDAFVAFTPTEAKEYRVKVINLGPGENTCKVLFGGVGPAGKKAPPRKAPADDESRGAPPGSAPRPVAATAVRPPAVPLPAARLRGQD
jgi:hypothetical protein